MSIFLYESTQLYTSKICDTLVSFRLQTFQKDYFGAFSCYCSRMPSYCNNCACSESVCRIHYCDSTTRPRKYNRELQRPRPIRNCDSVQTSLTVSSAPARAPFSSYLRDVQALALILLRTHLQFNNNATGGRTKSEKAVEYERSRLFLT